MKPISVIVPILNEEDSIVETIDEILDTAKNSYFGPGIFKVLVIDNCSRDASVSLVKSHPEYGNKVDLITKSVTYHIRDSLQLGFEEMKKYYGEIEYVVVMDAGKSWNFDEIYRHLSTPKVGIIAGYRDKKILFKKKRKRAILSMLGTFLFNIINLRWFKDCTCGFRAYNMEIVKRMDWSKILGRRFDIQLSLISYLRRTSIYWVPVEYNYTTSSLNMGVVLSSLWYMIRSIFYKPAVRPSEESI